MAWRTSLRRNQSTHSLISHAAPDAPAMAAAGLAAVGTLAGAVQNRNDILPWLSSHNGQGYSKSARLDFAVKPSDTNITLRVFVDHSVTTKITRGAAATHYAVCRRWSNPTRKAGGR